MLRRLSWIAALVGLAAPAAAHAAYVPIAGYRAPGTPARYDRVFVTKTGPASARRVLVLVPGFLGGAGDFTLVARELVRRVPNLQVWALDRRSNALEDTSRFAPGPSLQAASDYYQGLRFHQVDGPRDAPFARDWGLRVALEDLRRVVLAARAGGRRQVILGGHSLGASTTVAYATWDFAGHPGYRDLAGLVLIDGGLLGTFSHPGLASVRGRLSAIRRGDPFEAILPGLPPWAGGVFLELGAMFARQEPNADSPLQDSSLLPAFLKPPVRVTNEALLGYDLEASTGPPALSLVRFRAGGLAPAGDPRPWRNGEVTPIQNVARTFWQEPGNGVEWYFPKRLRLDVDGDSDVRPSAITRLLGLRPFHTAEVGLPLYAIQTDLTHGRVLRGARAFVRRSRIRRATLVDWSRRSSHLDPLVAAPARNRFLATVVPFLRGLG